jgi:SAM-dependent methyltransferase
MHTHIYGQDRRTADRLPPDYYEFNRYVSKERMITFWYQLHEVISAKPASVLEVGSGPGVVAGALRECGVAVKTADSNISLRPDYLVPVQDLTSRLVDDSFDVVICARVLHHVPFRDFDRCIEQLWRVTKSKVVLTLPVEDLRIYTSFRITSLRSIGFSLHLPVALKKMICRVVPSLIDMDFRRRWKINSESATALQRIEGLLARRFHIEKSYRVPEDMSHHVFVLSKCNGLAPVNRNETPYESTGKSYFEKEVKYDDYFDGNLSFSVAH